MRNKKQTEEGGLFLSAGHIHTHDTGPVKYDPATTGDHPFYRFTGFGMLLKGFILHRLNQFKAFWLLAFFLRYSLVNVGRHKGDFD